MLTSGVTPAAAVTGTRLVGQSLSNLRKALADRANQISANTAKYIDELTQREYQRSVAQVTAQQNAERLGTQAAYNQAKIDQGAARIQLDWAKLQHQVEKDRASGAGSAKTIRGVQTRLLTYPDRYTVDKSASSGKSKYTITWDDGTADGASQTVVASSQDEAVRLAGVPAAQISAYSSNPNSKFAYRLESVVPQYGVPLKRGDATRRMVDVLVTAGMARPAAVRWVTSHAVSLGLTSLPA